MICEWWESSARDYLDLQSDDEEATGSDGELHDVEEIARKRGRP